MRSLRAFLASTSGLLVSALASSALAAPWNTGTPLLSARSQARAVVDSTGTIHILGGHSSADAPMPDHDVLLSDGGWTSLAPMPSALRAGAAVTGNDGVLYYIGGFSGTEENSTFAFELDGGWATLASPPSGTGWETSGDVGIDGKIYVFGGEGSFADDSGSGDTNPSTQIYDPVATTWTQGADMPARRKQHRALRGSDGNFYIIGGADENDVAQNTVFVYHPTTDTWTTGPSLTFPLGTNIGDAGDDASDNPGDDAGDGGTIDVPILSFAGAATPDRTHFVLVGGSTAEGNLAAPYFDTVYVFDVAAQKWTVYPFPIPTARREATAAISGCSLVVLGGAERQRLDTNEMNRQLFDALCTSNAAGSKCIEDTTTHCGCTSDGDCAGASCNTTTHICSAVTTNDGGSTGDGGIRDGGSARDGGGLGGGDASTSPSDGGSGDNGDNGGSSSGCGCNLLGESDSSALAWSGFALVGLVAARRRTRRR